MTRYLEHVHSPRWFIAPVLATTIATCLIGLWLLIVTGETLAGLILVGAGGAVTLIVRTLLVLRIEVDETTLQVRLGPFGLHARRRCHRGGACDAVPLARLRGLGPTLGQRRWEVGACLLRALPP